MHYLKRALISFVKPFVTGEVFAQLQKPMALHYQETIGRANQKTFFAKFIQPGDLVFDVGANVGYLVGIFLDLGATVVAVEPNPDCVAILNSKYGNCAVQVVPAALSAAEGEATMHLCDVSVSGTLSTTFVSVLKNSKISDWFRARTFTGDITVTTRTLDSLIATYGLPSFCKIDVEGFEAEVISGLSEPINSLSLEYTGEALEPIFCALDRLDSLAAYSYNYDKFGQPKLELKSWCNSKDIRKCLKEISQTIATGNVYAVRSDQPA